MEIGIFSLNINVDLKYLSKKNADEFIKLQNQLK